MKKVIVPLIGVCLALVAVIAVYRFGFRKSLPEAEPALQVSAVLDQNGCYDCHSSSQKKPFYASFPIIGPQLNKHIQHGTGFFDLDRYDLEQPSEVLLSMLEYTVQQKNMPIAEYKLMHWGTGYNKQERSLLTKWVMDERASRYASGLAAPEFASEVVQVIPEAIETDAEKVALGKKMYNDTRLSLDNTISCATCHILEDGGADEPETRTSEGINGNFGGINAPTVFNAVFNARQFWNGRAHTLADQAAGPPENPMEMGDQTWDQIVERLRTDASLVKEFEALYPGEGLTRASVTDAIAEYEKTLLTPNDRLDLYLKGNSDALTAQELSGYNAFKDNSCATCHVGKTLGGQSFELMGIFEDYFADREQSRPDVEYNDDDKGLAGFTGKDEDLHRFKVPNLRNISMTPPYFHDGTRASIEDAVKDMFRFELGKKASEQDVASISAFLRALDGDSPYFE